jgi:hypothetical protein
MEIYTYGHSKFTNGGYMFSIAQKRFIAATIETCLLKFHHPEMPLEKPKFKLHVDGAESWSWADIEPNWIFDDAQKQPDVNPYNELVTVQMDKLDKIQNEISALINEFYELYDGDLSGEAVSLLLTNLQKLIKINCKPK